MITQAWQRHRRDQLAVSTNAAEINEIFHTTWLSEMKEFANESFVTVIDLPNPFVTEVYTDTEPIAKAAVRAGLNVGESLTLASGWDFHLKSHRQAALQRLRREKPYAVILAFPCGPWSPLHHLNPPLDLSAMRAASLELIEFAIEVADLQSRQGRHFLMENPKPSLAWKQPCLKKFLERPGCLSIDVDMCRFGLKGPGGGLHRKSTKLVTRAQALISHFIGRTCQRDHEHEPVIGGSKITSAAGHYSKAFSEAVIKAFQDQFDFETLQCFQNQPDSKESPEDDEVEVNLVDFEALGLEAGESDDSLEVGPLDEKLVIPSEIKNAVYRLHTNTGHRSPKRLARALLISGAPHAAVVAAKNLQCSICKERRSPKPRPPGGLPPPREVGQQIHVDLVLLEDSLRRSYVIAHATDNVSRYQAAKVIKDKSTASVIHFLKTHWQPLLGWPQTIVADQGREFISAEFGDWCDSQSIYLYHIGVGAPWQNGVAERSGGTLKALVGAITQSNAVSTFAEMEEAVGEAVMAYNSDINEHGVAPIQLVTGRIPTPVGDVLNNFSKRLVEHSLLESSTSLERQLAVRQTARLAMLRLHYSRGLRQPELARSRESVAVEAPQPGDLVFFWRAQKYQSRKDGGTPGTPSRRRLQLKRWHGPALLVAREGRDGDEFSSNCFVSFRGQLTKCPTEHVRKASSLESIAAGSWEAAIDEVIQAAVRDASNREQPSVNPGAVPPEDGIGLDPSVGLGLGLSGRGTDGLSPGEVVAALQPAASGQVSSGASMSAQQSMPSIASTPLGAQPGTPLPDLILQASQVTVPSSPTPSLRSNVLARARQLDDEARGQKRAADDALSPGQVSPTDAGEQGEHVPAHEVPVPADEQATFEVCAGLTMTHDQIQALAAERTDVHPLLRLACLADLDRRDPLEAEEHDHGTWDGRWSFMCQRDWDMLQSIGAQLPSGQRPLQFKQLARSISGARWTVSRRNSGEMQP